MKRLDIAGHGLHRGHITSETSALVEKADIVFFLASDDVAGLLSDIEQVDWRPLYENEALYLDIYHQMISSVFKAGRWERGLVLVEGNSAFFTGGVIPQIAAEARRRQWEVHMYPGVSCFDTILVDLELDVDAQGLQVVDTKAMVAGRHPIHADTGCLMLQPSLWASPDRFVTPAPSEPEAYEGLRDVLLRTYPAAHSLFIVESAMDPSDPALIVRSSVAALPDHAEHLSHFASIYVPPVQEETHA